MLHCINQTPTASFNLPGRYPERWECYRGSARESSTTNRSHVLIACAQKRPRDGRFVLFQNEFCLEPLVRLINESYGSEASPANAGSQHDNVVKGNFPVAVQDVVSADRQASLAFDLVRLDLSCHRWNETDGDGPAYRKGCAVMTETLSMPAQIGGVDQQPSR